MNAAIREFQYPPSRRTLLSVCADAISRTAGSEESRSLSIDRIVEGEECRSTKGAQEPAENPAIIFERGRAQGYREGRAAEQSDHAAATKALDEQRIERASKLTEEFALLRDAYFRKMETEVVKLALLIASRVLRREAEMDPLCLIGAVRLVLQQLADRTNVRICVPACEADLWSETISHLPHLRVKPVVLADEALEAGECRLETESGSANLGADSQLGEIERALIGNSEGAACARRNE